MTTRRAPLAAERLASKRFDARRLPGTLWVMPRRFFLWSRAFLGRHLSVRWKLTLWYGLMCAVTLGLIGQGMRTALTIRTDSLMNSSMHTTAAVMLQKLHQPSSAYNRAPFRPAFVSYYKRIRKVLRTYSTSVSAPGQFEQVQLVNPSPWGMSKPWNLYSPMVPSPAHTGVLLTAPLVSEAASANRPVTTSITVDGEQVKLYLIPLSPPRHLVQDNVLGVLEIFQPEHTYLAIQQDVDRIILFGIPLGLLVALVVGWWVARAALRPIDRISRTVHVIGESRDLSRRLNFVGPMDEVGRLAETFDHMMDRLEKVFETQKRFIADASHELRTPLTAIRGNAELFAMAPPEERELCIASIRREAERMSRLVADLLLLAAADVEEQPVQKRPVDLDELMLEVCRSGMVLTDGRLTVQCEPLEPVTILGDADRLKQLLLNLVDNAIKFTPDGGTITLSLYAESAGARLEVSDTGVGIPPEEQEAIFRRFHRLEAARSRRGSGLGLSISAWIAAAHGGDISVRSEPGRGSTFTVRLPGRINHPIEVPSVLSSRRRDQAR